MKTKSIVALTVLLILIILGFNARGFALDHNDQIIAAQNDNGDGSDKQKHKGSPPQEAIEACAAQSVGYTCEFMLPEGDVIQGVCEIIPGDIIACLPDNRPPHN